MTSHAPIDDCSHRLSRFKALPLLCSIISLLLGAGISTHGATSYLFVPGHGLTSRTGNWSAITTDELIAECADMKWMRFIEREYEWSELETSEDVYVTSAVGQPPKGISRIVADAKACNSRPLAEGAPLKIRIMLMHKFTSLPPYLQNSDFSVPIAEQPGKYMIKLDSSKKTAGQFTVLQRLEKLYDRVILELKKEDATRRAFYGFVIQENALGSDLWYKDNPNDPVNPGGAHRTAFINNLKLFHTYLQAKLVAFDSPNSVTGKPGRLFWQMVNAPYDGEAEILINHLATLKGAGLCGPDTFPREPAPGKTSTASPRRDLIKTYNRMRTLKTTLPISLHVYHLNYWNPYVHAEQDLEANLGKNPRYPSMKPQPLDEADTTPSKSSYTEAGLGPAEANGAAGVGIMNFLGVLNSNEPDNMNVHNVVWAMVDAVPYQANYTPPTPTSEWGPYGWSNVMAFMNNSTHFDRASVSGGCTTAIPSKINDLP